MSCSLGEGEHKAMASPVLVPRVTSLGKLTGTGQC